MEPISRSTCGFCQEDRAEVTALDDQIDDELRGVSGILVITSNDHTEPQKELELFGFGGVNRASQQMGN